MGNQEELLLPVLNLIVQIPLVLALSVLWYTFIFTPFGVQEYVRTSIPLYHGFHVHVCTSIPYIFKILYVRTSLSHICDLIADRNIDGARKILDSHTEKSSTDIVLYSQIYEIEGDYDKAATVILDYLKDNDSGTAVRMYNRLKHLKPHCSSDISEQITPYEN